MKKYLILLILAFSASSLWCVNGADCTNNSNNCSCDDRAGHSFMFTRPLNQNLAIQQSVRHLLIHDKKGDAKASFELAAVYQQSMPSPKVARYFLFLQQIALNEQQPIGLIPNEQGTLIHTNNCKNKLLVAGDTSQAGITISNARDIRAEWIGLPSNFYGYLTLNPEQRQMALIASYNQDLGGVVDCSLLDNMWINVEVPVIGIEQNIGLEQHDMRGTLPNSSPANPGNIVDAFNQNQWLYGHICGPRSAVHVAEINFKLGSTYMSDNDFVLDYYSMLSAPTGNQQNARYLFDPVVGNNGHWGIGAGVNMQLLLNRDITEYRVCFFLNFETLFLIHGTEVRTLDLWNKPWSRYLLLTHKNGPLGNSIPAVNFLTREVEVHPYNCSEMSTGWRYKTDRTETEVGFDVWGHATEKIVPACPFSEVYGILGDTSGVTPADLLPNHINNVSASKSTISNQAPLDVDAEGNYIFIPIRNADLSVNSAAAQAAVNLKCHACFTCYKRGAKIDGAFCVGIWFEWPLRNTSLQAGGGWAKVGAAF